MYSIGDKIFYPMHGAGVIEAIEEKEVLGEKQLYYIMNLSLGKLHVMIPTKKTTTLGVREIVNSSVMENVLNLFSSDAETETSVHPNQRYRNNMDKMKTGDIYEGARVIRDLSRISKKKSLGTSDKLMLNNARQILISELILVNNMEEEHAADYLNEVINK
ncbi:CarD family transcriptional regulator [Anaerobacillus isosaccharinicus]|uniref:CarD family transcriptional regulator n=1 Tax=Anaerobacillus isosaccharinicus TaxID=1532552 RepID=A0A1S2LHZ4_9BACI|nr:CarD family transcriptional regulator [Anaerobacillus isosaccharinicus]MBA5586120.1 CarD family transcriptional regulator [Anaerobacillus isosaccharinicus]QOY35612.1 CarD family transcriptional regulator [Anaerobacillus isosaccharinicus]